MKLLLVHNRYGSSAPSGENQVFEREARLLRSAGHEVENLVVSNDDLYEASALQLIGTAVRIPWSSRGLHSVRRAVQAFRPTIVHVHNTFPLLSPSIYYAPGGGDEDPAVVMTAHNYRMFCAAGNCMRNGKLCTKCIDTQTSRHAVVHGCYRNDRLKSVPVAAMIALHNMMGTFSKRVHAIIAQTGFQREILLTSGVPPQRVFVKPHCIIPELPQLPWNERKDWVVFVGRLSPEKGLDLLLEVWRRLADGAPELLVIGGGTDQEEYENRFKQAGLAGRVRFLGFVSEAQKWEVLRRCKLLVMPTQWYETFGLVLAEAFAVGVPVVASRLGCIPWVVSDGEEGLLVAPTDVESWVAAISRLITNDTLLQEMSRNCHARYSREYAVTGHVQNLERIYSAALTNMRHSGHGNEVPASGVNARNGHSSRGSHPADLAS